LPTPEAADERTRILVILSAKLAILTGVFHIVY